MSGAPRLVALWLVLFAAYAATIGVGDRGAAYAGEAAHHLVVAESIVSDGDLDARDEYAQRAYSSWHRAPLRPAGGTISGRLREPQGLGVGGLIAPAYALGGPRLAQFLLAAIAALAFVLAALVARRIVPEPWASGGAALIGLSAPALGAGAAIGAAAPAGCLLAGAMACALAVREHPRASASALGAAQLAALPWLSPTLAVPAIGVAVALVSWSARGRGRAGAMLPIEIMLASVVFEATLDEGLYGGLTPSAASVGGAGPALAHRLGRVAGLWIDRDAGLLRWAPALALAAFAGWLLWRSRREGLARALPARRDAEAAAALALSVCVAQAAVAVLAATPLDPVGFPGASWAPALPAAGALCGWGLRHAPRTGAVLAALTLAASAWLLIALRTGSAPSWDAPPRAPWGPLTDAFPRTGTAASAIVALAALVLLAALAVRERRGARSARFARPA